MRMQTMVARTACALVMALAVFGAPGAAPAGANVHDVHLGYNTMSPKWFAGTGCHIRISYGNYGAAPFAGLRTYGSGCGGLAISIWSADSNGTRWTTSSTVAGTGSDGCGSYSAIQATGPAPGYGLRARLTFPDGSQEHFAADGTDVFTAGISC